MNNEQIIDEAYENYCKSFENQFIIDQYSFDTDPLTQLMFIEKCKIIPEFSERWGLKIEERELSLEERRFLLKKSKVILPLRKLDEEFSLDNFFKPYGIPTKLITLTYNNETIESYE